MEAWRPVVGLEGLYEVSNEGQVRSLPRVVRHYTGKPLQRAGRVLRGCVTQKGYVKVSLCWGGVVKGVHVHSLVAEAFIGPRPEGALVRHRDGDQSNNCATNLAYGTSQDNSDDMRRHGRVLAGERHGCAKLTQADVDRIRALADSTTQVELARQFHMSVQQISNIVRRAQWKDRPWPAAPTPACGRG